MAALFRSRPQCRLNPGRSRWTAPEPLSQISNKYVWLIVFAPIFLAAVELIEFWSPHTYSGVAPSFGKAGRASGSGLLW
jgi:hypothetical protein